MKEQKLVPIFPLGIVMLPGVTLALHIFEERYKRLIQDCVENDTSFGIVYYSGSSLINHGCTVAVEQILRAYPDGRMDILVRGLDRFYFSKFNDKAEVLAAELTFFDDEEDFTNRPLVELLREALEKYSAFRGLQEKQADLNKFQNCNPSQVSFLLSAEDFLTTEEKRANLEAVSLRCRFERIITALDRHIERLSCTKRIQQIIGEGGDFRNLLN